MTTRRRINLSMRSLLVAAGWAAALGPAWPNALAADKPKRIGVLFFTTELLSEPQRAALVGTLRERGWVEGKTVEFRFAYAGGDGGQLPALLDGLLVQQLDLLMVTTTLALQTARRANVRLPIVFSALPNLVGGGFVDSLARPGGNLTGLSSQYEEVVIKLVELVHDMVPSARRLAILLNDNTPWHGPLWEATRRACASLQLTPIRAVASTPAQLSEAVAQIVAQRAQAVVVATDPLFLTHRVRLHELLQATRLPVGFGYREHVQAGGLMSYGANLVASFSQAAKYVDKILRGALPADLPIEQPTQFELVINLKTAKLLGLKLPQTVLARAVEFIE